MIALVLAAALFAGEPAVPELLGSDCRMGGLNWCPTLRHTIETRFDVPAAQSLAANGYEGVRLFLFNDHMQPMPMVQVLKAQDGKVTIEARAASRDLEIMPRPGVTSQQATSWEWQIARTLGELVFSSPESGASPPSEVSRSAESSCLRPWVAVTEAIVGGKVAVRVRNACLDDPIFGGSYAFSATALNAFDGCWRLNPEGYSNDPSRLADCLKLGGNDRFAAAEVMNLLKISPLAPEFGVAPQGGATGWLATGAILSWAGQPALSGRDNVATFLDEELDGRRFGSIITSVAADEGGAVKVEGMLLRLAEVGSGAIASAEFGNGAVAAFVQEWSHNETEGWRVTHWIVQPFHVAQ